MKFGVFICGLVLLTQPAFAATGDQIGTLIEVEGSATISHVSGEREKAMNDAPVALDDVIETASDGRALIQFIDGTELIISANTKMTVDEFVYDPDNSANNKADYSILRGTFLYTSGLIAKRPNPDVTVNTAYGSIGIRGTQFWGGPIDGAFGLLVNDGAVTIKNAAGQVSLAKGEGTSIPGFRTAPGVVKKWSEAKIGRAVATISLKNAGLAKERIAKRAALNKKLVTERKQRLMERRGDLERPGVKPRVKALRKWQRPARE